MVYDLLKLNQDAINNLNQSIISNEFVVLIYDFLTKKSSGPQGFTSEFYQLFKWELTPILLTLLHKREKELLTKLFSQSNYYPTT